jgi:ribokinase
MQGNDERNVHAKVKIIGPGSSNVDLTGFAPHLPVAGETVMGTNMHISVGGKGSNQMTAAARAGGEVYFITRIGQDVFGDTLRRHFEGEGFCTAYIASLAEETTGCALIEIDQQDGQNRIMVIPGANLHLTPADVMAAEGDFSDADAVIAQLEIPMDTVAAAKTLAHRYGKPFILNPAPFGQVPDGLFEGVDWLTPNETEASFFTGVEVKTIEDARQAASLLLKQGVKNVVITLGVGGAFWTNGTDSCHVPGIPVKAVETTGAGDTFNGALAVAIAEGRSPKEALRFANAAAALSVTRLGAATSAPRREEIQAFMQ